MRKMATISIWICYSSKRVVNVLGDVGAELKRKCPFVLEQNVCFISKSII